MAENEIRFIIKDESGGGVSGGGGSGGGGSGGGGGGGPAGPTPKPRNPTVTPFGPDIDDKLLRARNQVSSQMEALQVSALVAQEKWKQTPGNKAQMIGGTLSAAGYGGVGNLLGKVGEAQSALGAGATGLAAINPIIGAVMAGKQVIDTVVKFTTDSITEVGHGMTAIAKLDTGAAADSITKVVKATGVFGQVMGTVSDSFREFAGGLDQTAAKLAMYNGPLAGAQANAQVGQVMGDMRRADLLGPQLAQWVESRSRIEQAGQDVLAQMLRPVMPPLNNLLSVAAPLLENFAKGLETLINFNEKLPVGIFEVLFPQLAIANRLLGIIAFQTKKDPPESDSVTQFNSIEIPGSSAMGRMGDERNSPRMNQPAFGV